VQFGRINIEIFAIRQGVPVFFGGRHPVHQNCILKTINSMLLNTSCVEWSVMGKVIICRNKTKMSKRWDIFDIYPTFPIFIQHISK